MVGHEAYSKLRLQLGAAGARGFEGGGRCPPLRPATGCWNVRFPHRPAPFHRTHSLYWVLALCAYPVLTPCTPLPCMRPAASSSYWLYWVPSQAVSGIKMRVLGVGALL